MLPLHSDNFSKYDKKSLLSDLPTAPLKTLLYQPVAVTDIVAIVLPGLLFVWLLDRLVCGINLNESLLQLIPLIKGLNELMNSLTPEKM